MHSIIVFYSKTDSRSLRTFSLIKILAKKVKDVCIVAFDVSTQPGLAFAIKKRINIIPSLIIDGNTTIEGIPYSEKQILNHFRKD